METSTLERLKTAASRLLGRRGAPSAKAETPAALPSYRETATRGGRAAARSLARLSATSVISNDAAEDESQPPSLATSAADIDVSDVPTATTASASGSSVGNAVSFSRKATPSSSTTKTKPSASDVAAGRFDLGLSRDLDAHYDVSDKVLGSGGSGVVRLATSKRTGKTVAVKTIPKRLPADVSETKRLSHPDSLSREIDVLRRLRGALNVASLEDAFEDETSVHLVLEHCAGGELAHALGSRHYSERTAASYMRAVLRTLAQCHSAGILHRDVKPGNFMLLSDDARAPLKAVDFGLAAFFDPKDPKPREDLGLEGTPWYMAPEVLGSKVGPEADVWAAGVMAYQLLTGRFPFDDKQGYGSGGGPVLSRVWRSILTDKLRTDGPAWEGVSDEAKSFVRSLLDRDPRKRPTAAEALKHPWLSGGNSTERQAGRQLSLAVVQRVQRYASGSAFRRSVLEMIASELLADAAEAKRVQDRARRAAAASASSPATSASILASAASPPEACPLDATGAPLVTGPTDCAMEYLYEALGFAEGRDSVSRDELVSGLASLGYRLGDGEADRVLQQLGDSSRVTRAQLAASQIDWAALRATAGEDSFVALAKRAFDAIDRDRDGAISRADIGACLRSRAPSALGGASAADVDASIASALAEAAKRDDSIRDGLSFAQFLRMLGGGNGEGSGRNGVAAERAALELFDDRLSSGRGRDCARAALGAEGNSGVEGKATSPISIAGGGRGVRGASASLGGSIPVGSLPTVPEAQ